MSVPNSGASATLDKMIGVTDSTGAVTFQAMANAEAGTYSVQATSPGIAGTNFSLTNLEVAKTIEPPVQTPPVQTPPAEPPLILP
ncbi:MAG: hypothetical protein HC852_19090, partial [Acaryochloridaceae cyanobacterium RU_4_10]|nr:hypothetical protein [Acaryochloridaceae cyanobacterium RU_4_10]